MNLDASAAAWYPLYCDQRFRERMRHMGILYNRCIAVGLHTAFQSTCVRRGLGWRLNKQKTSESAERK